MFFFLFIKFEPWNSKKQVEICKFFLLIFMQFELILDPQTCCNFLWNVKNYMYGNLWHPV